MSSHPQAMLEAATRSIDSVRRRRIFDIDEWLLIIFWIPAFAGMTGVLRLSKNFVTAA